jgi:hypothetical protein
VDGGPSTEVHYNGVERMNVLGGLCNTLKFGMPSLLSRDWEVLDKEKEELIAHNKSMEAAFDKLSF